MVGEWIDSFGNKELIVVQTGDRWSTKINNISVQGTIHGNKVEMTEPSDWRCGGTLDGDVLRWDNKVRSDHLDHEATFGETIFWTKKAT